MATILLVEDDRRLASHWQQALETTGHRVIHETSVGGAIEVLDDCKIDLLVTDIVLESENGELAQSGGLAVISYIALHVHPQPKIIAISGAETNSNLVDYGFRPMEAFRTLRKPISVEELLAAVAKSLSADDDAHERAQAKELESALQSNLAMLELLGATDGVWDWRVGSEEVQYAPGFRKLLGFEGVDTIGFPDSLESLTDRIHSEDREAVWASINNLLQSRTTCSHEFRLRNKDDQYVWVRNRATASFNAQGEAVRVVGSMHDIADEVKARQALARTTLEAHQKSEKLLELNQQLVEAKLLAEESETRFREIADSAPAIIWMREADLGVSWANQQLETFTGKPRKSFYGGHWDDSIHPDDQATVRAAVQRGAQEHVAIEYECRIRRHDNEYRWFQGHCAPRFDAQGQFRGVVGIVTDIHLSREARLVELEKLNIELTRSNAELEQFAYVASHDLRSPLRGISNIVSFIREDEEETLSQSSKDHLDKLDERVSRMDTLLKELLTFSRAGRQNGEVVSIDIAEIVNDSVDLLSIPNGFQITVTTPLPVICTFATPMRHVFLNLIGNAIKHHDRDSGRIEIAAFKQGDFYRFSVSDDGPGIEQRYHRKIFGMFQRLHVADESGNGMGLAIIRRMVQRFGGDISLESTLGNGSTFSFTWPKETKADARDEPREPLASDT